MRVSVSAMSAESSTSVSIRVNTASRWRGFWILFCTFGLVLNVAGTSWFSEDGCLYNNLQPYVCLAVVLVGSQLVRCPRWLRGLLAAAWLIECIVRVAYLVRFQTQRLEMFDPAKELLFARSAVDANYLYNYTMKLKYGIVMLRDLFGDDQVWLVAAALAAAGLICCAVIFRQGSPGVGKGRT